MKKRRHISNIIATILMLFVSINSIPVSAAEAVEINTFNVNVNNVIDKDGETYNHLEWSDLGKGYTYRVFQKGQENPNYETIPTEKKVKTLNIYPDGQYIDGDGVIDGEKDLDGKTVKRSAILKPYLEKENIKDITIDCISLSAFNKEPSKYLKKVNGVWNYDSVVYGIWNVEPIVVYPKNETIDYLETFIDDGGGFMATHHTIGFLDLNLGVNRLANKMGVEIFGNNKKNTRDQNGNLYKNVSFETIEEQFNAYQSAYWPAGDKIKIKKNGLLINYPFKVGKVGDEITIPKTHGLSVFAKGDVWLDIVNPTAHNCEADVKFKEITKSPSTGESGTNNFYVHTYKNTAIVDVGHGTLKANKGEMIYKDIMSKEETRILANTLYYLAQITEETSCDDHKGQDLAAPNKPNINSVNYSDKNVKIKLDAGSDNGSTYEYYVEATEKGTNNKIKSNSKSTTITSGIKGYSIVVDTNKYTVPKNEVTTTNTEFAIAKDFDSDFYVHVAAIDNADNISEVSTYKYTYPTLKLTAGEVENNTVKITAEGNDKVTKIVLPNTKEVTGNKAEYTVSANGTYNFSAFDNDGNKVTKSIRVNNLATDITLDVTANENSASLNWTVSDKSQDYSYTVNSTREDGSKNSVSSLTETSYEDTNSKDVAAPSKPDITKVNTNRNDNTTTIKFNKSTDNGTKYDFNVEAKAKETGLVSTSETKTATIKSGIKGYSVVVDNNENTVPDGTITTTSNELTLDSRIDGGFYVHVVAIDKAGNMSEVSTYKYSYPTLTLTPNTTEIVKDNVKITADATKSVNKVVTIITPDGKEVAGDKTEYTVDENGEYTFIAIDEDGNRTPKTIVISNIVPDIILNVEPNMNKAHLKEKVVVDLTINNIKDIYATQVKIKYDSSKLEFLGFDEVEGVNLLYSNKKNGELTLLLKSLNANYPMVGKSTLIKMNFRGINAGNAKIDVEKGKVADGRFLEKNLRDAECGSTNINICERQLKDKYTLLDLSRIVFYCGGNPEDLLKEGLDLDLNLDGKIDEADCEKCKELMLQNPDNDL